MRSKTVGDWYSAATEDLASRTPFFTEKTNGLPSENQVPRTPASSAGTSVPGTQASGGSGSSSRILMMRSVASALGAGDDVAPNSAIPAVPEERSTNVDVMWPGIP